MLAALGSCGACHTKGGARGAPYAGGYAIETPQGTFYGPNITPHPTEGIGAWTYTDFKRALTRGKSPKGTRYWPAFPYPSYTLLHEQEIADLWAYLQTLPPDPRPNTPHDLGKLRRFPAVLMWRLLYFDKGEFKPDPTQSAQWNEGAYLGRGIGHCAECHSPRNKHGAVDHAQRLQGQSEPPEPAPDISQRALSRWSHSDVVTFLEDGMTAEGDWVGGEMARIVETGTARLSADEREALATWLRSVGEPPPPREEEEPEEDDDDREYWE